MQFSLYQAKLKYSNFISGYAELMDERHVYNANIWKKFHNIILKVLCEILAAFEDGSEWTRDCDRPFILYIYAMAAETALWRKYSPSIPAKVNVHLLIYLKQFLYSNLKFNLPFLYWPESGISWYGKYGFDISLLLFLVYIVGLLKFNFVTFLW